MRLLANCYPIPSGSCWSIVEIPFRPIVYFFQKANLAAIHSVGGKKSALPNWMKFGRIARWRATPLQNRRSRRRPRPDRGFSGGVEILEKGLLERGKTRLAEVKIGAIPLSEAQESPGGVLKRSFPDIFGVCTNTPLKLPKRGKWLVRIRGDAGIAADFAHQARQGRAGARSA